MIVLRFIAIAMLVAVAASPARAEYDYFQSIAPDEAVKISLWSHLDNIDPAYGTTVEDVVICQGLFETLVSFDENGLLEPAHAQSWTISQDQRTYTFHLREDLTWTDGAPVVAADYVLAFQRIMDKRLNKRARLSYLLVNIRNARKIIAGDAALEDLGVRAPDPYTLEIELEAPASYFTLILTYPALTAVPSHRIAIDGDDWWRQNPLVSNGPYSLMYRGPDGFVLKRRDGHWRVPEPEYIALHYYKNQDDVLRNLMANHLDIAFDVRYDQVGWVGAQEEYNLHSHPLPLTLYGIFNTRLEKFADPRVRRALAMSIEREFIASVVEGDPAWTFSPPELLVLSAAQQDDWPHWPRARRLEEARALLAEAGYGPDNPLDFTIMTARLYDIDRVVQAVVGMMSQIGASVEIEIISNSELSPRLTSKQYEFAVGAWYADYPDPTTFLELLRSDNPKNHSAFSNPDYDALVAAAALTMDTAERLAIFRRLEEIIREESPIVPLVHPGFFALTSKRIKSFGSNRGYQLNLDHIKLK